MKYQLQETWGIIHIFFLFSGSWVCQNGPGGAKVSLTDGGIQYISIIMDYFTKLSEAHPLKSKTAVEVTNCILDILISRIPNILISWYSWHSWYLCPRKIANRPALNFATRYCNDTPYVLMSKCFTAVPVVFHLLPINHKVNSDLWEKLGIKRSIFLSNHPRTSGFLEEVNGTI